MPNRPTNFQPPPPPDPGDGGAQRSRDQAVLPFRVACQLCLNGIRTRLGRSAITLLGVALGIAFLMSVLTGFHLRAALSGEMALAREMLRRTALLRSEIGQLRGKTVAFIGDGAARADARLVEILEQAEVQVIRATGADAPMPDGDEWPATDMVLILGGDQAVWPRHLPDTALAGRRTAFFETPATAVRSRLDALDISPRALTIETTHDADGAQARDERMRLYWIVTLSLLITVGGVTNALLMSVTERFREIATMKCLGALSAFVIKLFLIESALIGAVGSLLGMLIGLLLPALIYGYSYGFARLAGGIDPAWLGLAGLGCLLVGTVLAMISGIYPARVAARMIPADALRSNI